MASLWKELLLRFFVMFPSRVGETQSPNRPLERLPDFFSLQLCEKVNFEAIVAKKQQNIVQAERAKVEG